MAETISKVDASRCDIPTIRATQHVSLHMLLAALVSRVGALAPRISAPAKRRVVRSMASTGLTDHEKFLFDLNGYLVVRGALSADEISELNAAIDAHSHEAISRDATALGWLPPYYTMA